MATRPWHLNCWHCSDCGLPICPECDTEGQACECTDEAIRPDPVDVRFHRHKPRRDQGAGTIEWALVSMLAAGIAIASAAMFRAVYLSIDDVTKPVPISRQVGAP